MKKIISLLLAAAILFTMAFSAGITASAEEFGEPSVKLEEKGETTSVIMEAQVFELIEFYLRYRAYENAVLYFNIEIEGYEFILMFKNNDRSYEYDITVPEGVDGFSVIGGCKVRVGLDKLSFRFNNDNPCVKDLREAEEYSYICCMMSETGYVYYGSDKPVSGYFGGRKNISKLEYDEIKDYTYTGKSRKPSVGIYDGDYKLKKGTDFTVSYEDNKEIGKASVIIKGKGKYAGEKKLFFNITPEKPALKVKKLSDKKVRLMWETDENAYRYQIYMSVNGGEFERVCTLSGDKEKRTVKELDLENNTYRFKIRSYKRVDGTNIYSPYSRTVRCGKK